MSKKNPAPLKMVLWTRVMLSESLTHHLMTCPKLTHEIGFDNNICIKERPVEEKKCAKSCGLEPLSISTSCSDCVAQLHKADVFEFLKLFGYDIPQWKQVMCENILNSQTLCTSCRKEVPGCMDEKIDIVFWDNKDNVRSCSGHTPIEENPDMDKVVDLNEPSLPDTIIEENKKSVVKQTSFAGLSDRVTLQLPTAEEAATRLRALYGHLILPEQKQVKVDIGFDPGGPDYTVIEENKKAALPPKNWMDKINGLMADPHSYVHKSSPFKQHHLSGSYEPPHNPIDTCIEEPTPEQYERAQKFIEHILSNRTPKKGDAGNE